MLILQWVTGNQKQVELMGEELFRLSESIEPRESKLDKFAQAIIEHETGGNPNSLPMRLNNPAAFRFSEWQRKFGGQSHKSGYTQFPTLLQGKAALRAFLKTHAQFRAKLIGRR